MGKAAPTSMSSLRFRAAVLLILAAAFAFLWAAPPLHRGEKRSRLCAPGSHCAPATSQSSASLLHGGSASSSRSTTSSSSSTSSGDLTDGPWLVHVLLGDPHFQHYAMTGLRQARRQNPWTKMVLVVSPELYELRPEWLPQLDALRVNLVNYTMLKSDYISLFARHYGDLWETLRRKVGFMLPTIADPTGKAAMNFAFTQFTMERLFAVYQLMHVYGLKNVLHLENDQMVYNDVGSVARAAQSCGVRLAMTRIGVRMAPAVVYAADADSLKDMLDFILDAISHGTDHAIQIAGTGWVTDMSLTAVYFARHRDAASKGDEKSKGISTFPNKADDSCMFNELNMVFDAAPLGHWCCGTFEKPKEYFIHKDAESEVPYWDTPFEWVNASEGAKAGSGAKAGVQQGPKADVEVVSSRGRVPTWGTLPVFNLHIHSKQLHMWES
jgi:hypothetical protein